jgi:hypothetical protein
MKKIEYNIYNGDGYYRLYSFASSHKYKKDIIDIFDVSSFSRLIRNINSVSSNIDVADYEKGKSLEECQNSFKGDLFELFTIIFLTNVGGGSPFYLSSIEWAKLGQTGYDFKAIDKNGNEILIQSKYRSNPQILFESDSLENFFIESQKANAFLFTSSSKISERYRRAERESKLVICDYSKINRLWNKGYVLYQKDRINKLFS